MIISNTFRNNIATGRLTFPVVIVISVCLWLIGSSSWTDFISLGIYALTGYFLIELNTRFSLIRTRTTLHVSFFWIFMSVCIFLHKFQITSFIPLLFVLSISRLFKSYENERPEGNIVYSFFYLSIASIISPIMIYFAPLFLFSMIGFRCFRLKSFFAALIGLIAPFWFYFAYCLWMNQMYLFLMPFENLIKIEPLQFNMINIQEIVSLGVIVILSLISISHYIGVSYQDKTRTRIFLYFLIFVEIWTAILFFINPSSLFVLSQIIILCCSILAAHYFTLTRNFFSNILFIIIFVIIMSLAIYNIWMQFFNF